MIAALLALAAEPPAADEIVGTWRAVAHPPEAGASGIAFSTQHRVAHGYRGDA